MLRIITRLNIGGPAVHVRLLAEGLRDRGFETTLVVGSCCSQDGEAPADDNDSTLIVHVPEMSRSLSPIRDTVALIKLVRLMRTHRPEIVHTHLSKAGVLGRLAALITRVPIVVHTFHGNTLSGYFSALHNWVFRRIERALAHGSDCICVVSRQQHAELTERFRVASTSKVRVVALAIELEAYLALPLPSKTIRRLTVGWLGRLVAVKNVPLLTRIVRECLSRGVDVQFLIAGDGPEQPHIQSLLASVPADRVRYLGWQTDVAGFVGQCDVLLQTSRNEGTPLALIQGMAGGRPFISTAVGGVVDMVSGRSDVNHGSEWFANGVLCNADPGAFAQVIQQLHQDPIRVNSMGRAARAHAERHYGSRRLLADVGALYQDLLQQNEHRRTA